MQSILCKEGYLIKNNESEKIIEELKEELKVTPFNPYQYNMKKGKDESFVVYQENENYFSIPKIYGIEKFGKPKTNEELLGKK